MLCVNIIRSGTGQVADMALANHGQASDFISSGTGQGTDVREHSKQCDIANSSFSTSDKLQLMCAISHLSQYS